MRKRSRGRQTGDDHLNIQCKQSKHNRTLQCEQERSGIERKAEVKIAREQSREYKRDRDSPAQRQSQAKLTIGSGDAAQNLCCSTGAGQE